MRARLAPPLVALSLAAAGCSDDGGAAGPTLPPLTESPSESPSPSAVAVPSDATAATPEGAADFGRFFASEVHQAYVTLNPERVRRLSTPDCGTCQRYVDSIESIRAQGATINDAYQVEVLDAAAPQEQPGATTSIVTVFLSIGELVVTGPDGAELLRETANEQAVHTYQLLRSGERWLVSEVTID